MPKSVRVSLVPIIAVLIAAGAGAQGISARRDSALTRVRQLAADGEMAEARQLLDSLLAAAPDSNRADELLFARASYAEDIQSADSDYRRIIASFRSSPRREESLLRLAQQSLIAGDTPGARRYLQQIAAEYKADSSQARASYWLAKTFVEAGDSSSACAANARALGLLKSANTELRAQIESQAISICANSAAANPPVPAGKKPRPPAAKTISPPVADSSPVGARYSVQLAAFDRRVDAELLAGKLRKSGLDARVDGSVKPFRVWVGHYATHSEAVAGQRALKARNLSGFVTETR